MLLEKVAPPQQVEREEDDGSVPARSTVSPVVRGSRRATERACVDDVAVEGHCEAEAAEDRAREGAGENEQRTYQKKRRRGLLSKSRVEFTSRQSERRQDNKLEGEL